MSELLVKVKALHADEPVPPAINAAMSCPNVMAQPGVLPRQSPVHVKMTRIIYAGL